jgi:putative DNA primase/helicase
MVGSGAPAPKHGFKADDAEMDKMLGGAASEARAVVCFDNLNVPLGGDSLDRAITCGGTYAYRQLGQNKTVHSAWRAVLFFTGNNVRIRGDIGRRVVVCRLESPEEKPSLRRGLRHPDLRAYVRQSRVRLAGLALTVLRAFCLVPHGARPDVVPLGSFESWARLVAGALVWLGEASPLDAVADARDEVIDPHRASLRVLLAGWNALATHPRAREYWGEYGMAARHVVNALYPLGTPAVGDGFDELREAIEGLTAPPAGKAPLVRHLGTALARVRGQWAGGRQLVGRPDRKGVMVWRVATRTGS